MPSTAAFQRRSLSFCRAIQSCCRLSIHLRMWCMFCMFIHVIFAYVSVYALPSYPPPFARFASALAWGRQSTITIGLSFAPFAPAAPAAAGPFAAGLADPVWARHRKKYLNTRWSDTPRSFDQDMYTTCVSAEIKFVHTCVYLSTYHTCTRVHSLPNESGNYICFSTYSSAAEEAVIIPTFGWLHRHIVLPLRGWAQDMEGRRPLLRNPAQPLMWSSDMSRGITSNFGYLRKGWREGGGDGETEVREGKRRSEKERGQRK